MTAIDPGRGAATGEAVPPPARRRQVLRFIGTLAVFALIGPVIGGLVVMIGFMVFGLGIASPADAFWVLLAMIVYGLWAAYPLGIVPSLCVGAFVALKDAYGGTPVWLAALAGGVAGAVWGQFGQSSGTGTFFFPTLIAAGVAGTLVCWLLTRRRATPGAAP